jgi:hypothetical protein
VADLRPSSSELSAIEQTICDALTTTVRSLTGDLSRDWTPPIKAALRDLGRREGHLVFGAPSIENPDRERDREFLVDLAWARTVDGRRAGLIGLALAVEMEWDNRDEQLLADFLKLTVIVADLRIFVFDIPSSADAVERKFALLKSACRVPQGHRYLAVGIESKYARPFKVECRAWTH